MAIVAVPKIIDELYSRIPDNKRISYGRVHTIKVLSKFIYEGLAAKKAPVLEISAYLFDNAMEFKGKSVALGMISYCGIEAFEKVLPYFESAATHQDWDVREMSQMFFRKLIKAHPSESKKFLLRMACSKDPNARRFVGETLRPVQENQWFYKDPEYSLEVLRLMFKERSAYPRTAVGNNLSDLARRCPELVYALVEELVASGDKNSYWIAYRACRNLVKMEPEMVMGLLKVKEYKYKDREYTLSDENNHDRSAVIKKFAITQKSRRSAK